MGTRQQLKKRLVVLVLLVLPSVSGELFASQTQYALTPLPEFFAPENGLTPVVKEEFPCGLNNVGQVVWQTNPAGGFMWSAEGGQVKLPWPPGVTYTGVRDINDSGQIAGYVQGGPAVAILWEPAGGITELAPCGYPFDAAINSSGQVVGYVGRAFSWSSGTGWAWLDMPSGISQGRAYDINNAGQIAGDYVRGSGVTGGDTHWAIIWELDGTWTELGHLDGTTGSYARAINEDGHAVGESGNGGGTSGPTTGRAFLWTEESGMKDLGVLSGGTWAGASDINNNGQVVGWSYFKEFSWSQYTESAFIWTEETGMLDLNDLTDDSADGWSLWYAHAINDVGQIVGYGQNPSGQRRAFLLTPVPEPATAMLVVMGGLAMLSRRRNRER